MGIERGGNPAMSAFEPSSIPKFAMATSMPFPFKPQIPVIPPPDHHTFSKGPPPVHPPRSDFARAAYVATGVKPPQGTPPTAQTQPCGSPAPAPGGPNVTSTGPTDPVVDPRYLAMASRIASYYQQRCQAVANFQQQRCQAWANMHRQKCQEMMQAAMLVVAWYIRDRISRRHKRQRRVFKRGLQRKGRGSAVNRITKGEAVRRWVMEVPLGATASPPPPAEKTDGRDEEEKAFEMDKETAPDKDAHLFSMADNLIKSQLTRIDVPLLGTLDFDESDDSESEEEDGKAGNGNDGECDNYEQAEDEDMDDEEDYDDGYDEEPREAEASGSKSVHLGTLSKESRKRTSSCLS